MHDFTITPLGDSALVISFGNEINETINKKVLQLFYRLYNRFPFIVDLVPAYSSLTVFYSSHLLYSPQQTAFEKARELLWPELTQPHMEEKTEGRSLCIPVCYAGYFAPDLADVAAQKKCSVDDVVRLHTATSYRVYMIGFLPGFPYMGKLDVRIATPRKSVPRTAVPAGSVGIAGTQTGIYPLSSPGGWNLIGRTPVCLFNPNENTPGLLQPGDRVTFYSITEDEFENYPGRVA